MTVNTVNTSSDVSSRARPVWSWGTGDAATETARSAPLAEPETIELVGRAVALPAGPPADPGPPPAWGWDAATTMEVVLPPPDPWTWAAVIPGQEAPPRPLPAGHAAPSAFGPPTAVRTAKPVRANAAAVTWRGAPAAGARPAGEWRPVSSPAASTATRRAAPPVPVRPVAVLVVVALVAVLVTLLALHRG